jgi:hypothetical protein
MSGQYECYCHPAALRTPVLSCLIPCLARLIPLGRLNDLQAVRAANPGEKLLRATLISTAPFAFGLAGSGYYWGRTYPEWLRIYLLVSYGLLFYGELDAWWIPYFFRPDATRAARYQTMFGNTHAFLPTRHGIRPNTLHVMLHLLTLITVVLLVSLEF